MANRKRISSAILWVLASVTFLWFSIESLSQSQVQPLDSKTKTEDQATSCFEYVAMVKVEVTEQQGKEVADLKKDDFIIYEDGVKQEMVYWKRNVGSDRATDRAMYEAGYYPTNSQFRDEWRKIRVLVRSPDKRKLRVQFTPKGYYAKKELRK
jgi:hypothetical protein